MFSINFTKEFLQKINLKDWLMNKSSIQFTLLRTRLRGKINFWFSSWKRKEVSLLIMLGKFESRNHKTQNLDSFCWLLLKLRLHCLLRNWITKSPQLESIGVIKAWCLVDQWFWKTDLTSWLRNKRNLSNTTRSLTWRWFQKATSPTPDKFTKSLKAVSKDCWDLSWNIWTKSVKRKSKNSKRSRLKMILKRPASIKRDTSKQNPHWARQYKNSED